MATTSDLRKGLLIRYNNDLWRVVEYQHIAPGNWRAMVRMKLKNFNNGKVFEDRVRAGDPIDIIETEHRPATYLYKDGENFVFMDSQNFEQVMLSAEDVGERMVYMKENDGVELLVGDDGQLLDVEIPNFVVLKVVDAGIAVRGDTAASVLKTARLETGLEVQVPSFIREGDLVRIDTRNGEYLDRSK